MLRLRSSTGQVAAEYMGVLLVVGAIVTALLGSQLHTHIAVEAERAICKITGSTACGEPGEGDDPSGGDPEANQVYDNLARRSSTTPTRSAATPTTTPAPS